MSNGCVCGCDVLHDMNKRLAALEEQVAGLAVFKKVMFDAPAPAPPSEQRCERCHRARHSPRALCERCPNCDDRECAPGEDEFSRGYRLGQDDYRLFCEERHAKPAPPKPDEAASANVTALDALTRLIDMVLSAESLHGTAIEVEAKAFRFLFGLDRPAPPAPEENRHDTCGGCSDRDPDPQAHSCHDESAAAPAEAGQWKALDGSLFPSDGSAVMFCPVSGVERRPEAREWWRCNACGRTWLLAGPHPYCSGTGWSRVLEIERQSAGEKP